MAYYIKKGLIVTAAGMAQFHAGRWFPAPQHFRHKYQQQAQMVAAQRDNQEMEQAHCQANSQAKTRGQATEQEESRARS